MINADWRRIAGLHCDVDGVVGVVWLAHDPHTSTIHCYDAAVFRNEVFAVVAEGIAARGRHYPVAWRKQDKGYAHKLQKSGINMVYEPVEDSQSVADIGSLELWQMMRAHLFRVERRVGDWLKEYQNFYKKDSKIPLTGFPLMAATRHALQRIPFAKAERVFTQTKRNTLKMKVL